MTKPLVNPSSLQPPIPAVPMTLFPTLGSLQEVVDFADSKLPITDKNEMFSLLMTYHNTLLKLTQ
jgi:hypothetical protein